jgi:hypothetical protein
MAERSPQEGNGASFVDDSENEEIDGRLAPEPVGSIKSQNPGSVWQESSNDSCECFRGHSAVIEESPYPGAVGLGECGGVEDGADPGHADCSLSEDGENQSGEEVAMGGERPYTLSENSFETSEGFGFRHLVAFRGLSNRKDNTKWRNRQPRKTNRENCLSRTVICPI